MNTKLFMQDEQIEKTLDEWSYRSVSSKCDKIIFEGHPIVKSDGSQTVMKLVLRIERMELCHIVHPEAPVDMRPVIGYCTCKPLPDRKGEKVYCQFRKSTGECTSNFEDTEVECSYKCTDLSCDGYHVEPGDQHVLRPDCNFCPIYKFQKPKEI